MAWIRSHLQGVSTKANTEQQWAELQGIAHDDSPSQILDQDHLFIGKGKAYRAVPK